MSLLSSVLDPIFGADLPSAPGQPRSELRGKEATSLAELYRNPQTSADFRAVSSLISDSAAASAINVKRNIADSLARAGIGSASGAAIKAGKGAALSVSEQKANSLRRAMLELLQQRAQRLNALVGLESGFQAQIFGTEMQGALGGGFAPQILKLGQAAGGFGKGAAGAAAAFG